MDSSDDLFAGDNRPRVDMRMAITELKRELLIRRTHYPRWIKTGRIPEDIAKHRIECLEFALKALDLHNTN